MVVGAVLLLDSLVKPIGVGIGAARRKFVAPAVLGALAIDALPVSGAAPASLDYVLAGDRALAQRAHDQGRPRLR
jgi:hypothetical protein